MRARPSTDDVGDCHTHVVPGVTGADYLGDTVSGGGRSAATVLARLVVKPLALARGYSRAQFGPAWADTHHNGCDQRNDVLQRDLAGIHNDAASGSGERPGRTPDGLGSTALIHHLIRCMSSWGAAWSLGKAITNRPESGRPARTDRRSATPHS
jgi:hypothetical protein